MGTSDLHPALAPRSILALLGLVLIAAVSGCGKAAPSARGGGTSRAGAFPAGVELGGAQPRGFVPYLDVAVSTNRLQALARQGGLRALALGFVVAAGRRCQAAWDGGLGLSDSDVIGLARSARPIVSFGGQDGPDLAQQCGSQGALAAQYERAVEELHAENVDFDVESAALSDTQSIARRSQALAALQAWATRSDRPLSISLTLPADPSGLPSGALEVLRSAVGAGVRVAQVNLLAMDFGDSQPATTSGRMGRYVIATASAAERQLHALLPGMSTARTWSALGITAMIGRNDVSSELFTTEDANEVLRFVRAHHMGWLSFWSLARDRSCPRGVDPRVAHETCSGVAQAPFEFTRLFAGYGG